MSRNRKTYMDFIAVLYVENTSKVMLYISETPCILIGFATSSFRVRWMYVKIVR